jgi:hypothetical protein
MPNTQNVKCRAKGGVASCKDPKCPEKQAKAADRQAFINNAIKTQIKPLPVSQKAWDNLTSEPSFKDALRNAAMQGYRSYDVSTEEEGVEEAAAYLRAYYVKERENNNLFAADAVHTLHAHREEVRAKLKPMIHSYFRVGHLPADL